MDNTAIRILQLGSQGFCCSQILISLALEDMGEENVPLVRAMAGLCEGYALNNLCGVANGAACVLALYLAKGSAEEQSDERFALLLSQFMEWFKASSTTWGGITCEDILNSSGQNKEVCGDIMLRSRNKLLELFAEYDIDPTLPREQADEFRS